MGPGLRAMTRCIASRVGREEIPLPLVKPDVRISRIRLS
jgi:hypothetical protein